MTPPEDPKRWSLRRSLLVVQVVLVGALVGVGGYTFHYAEGFSYFGTEPATCVNCHIMRPQYDAWEKSSHHAVARCVDCHLPHSFIPKYLAKAENGYRHSREFTAGTFEEPISVKPRGREILQDNCVHCHAALVADINRHAADPKREMNCVQCHGGVGHGETARIGGPRRPEESAGEK